MKKRIVMFLAAMMAAMCAQADSWTDPDTGYTWTYHIYGDTAEIYSGGMSAAISPSPTGAVTIPSALGGKPVTSIGLCAFSYCSGLTSVTIPDSVTSIADDAFDGTPFYDNQPDGLVVLGKVAYKMKGTCPASVTIPNGVTSIGDYAFSGCSGLTSVTIPDSVTYIGYGAFSGTAFYNNQPDGLVVFRKIAYKMKGTCPESVTIPNGVTSIGPCAFSGCSGLTSVTIPNSVTYIEDEAFYDCSGLTSVTIPDSVTSIGWEAFSGCSGLTSVTIGNGVTSIGPYAFQGCSRLTSVTIGNGVTSIGMEAFSGCSGLTSVTIPNGVANIGEGAFSNCSGLTSVTIPDSVTSLSTGVFGGCGKLWAAWYRMLANNSAAGGGMGGASASVVTTVVQEVASPYALTNVAADRAIASVTVNSDCAIDSFVLKDGKVYDTMLRVVNTADHEVHLTLPAGYEYETFKGVRPLTIPANSRNMLSITRTADRTFLVSREELESVQ